MLAMNPCPCGYYGDVSGRCNCTPGAISRYRNKISGPLLDRIDLHVAVNTLPIMDMQNAPAGEASAQILARVCAAQARQLHRQGQQNNALKGRDLAKYCQLDNATQKLLATAMEKLNLSARAYDRILRVARTLADLSDAERIAASHVSEALAYRVLDRA